MWIFTSAGFVSAVEDTTDENRVFVRARDKSSLETMIKAIELAGNAEFEDTGKRNPDLDISEIKFLTKKYSDYPHRVNISKATLAKWLEFEVLNYLKYSNFKDALTAVRGEEWHDAAMNVWTSMLQVQDAPSSVYTPKTEEQKAEAWAMAQTKSKGKSRSKSKAVSK